MSYVVSGNEIHPQIQEIEFPWTNGRDEAFHHAFYKDLVKMLLEYDEVGTAQDIQKVATSFRMPAQHLMPDMEKRVRAFARHRLSDSCT